MKVTQMEYKSVNHGIKNGKFFFTDDGIFILITLDGQRNEVCIFCNKINAIGRKYADGNMTILDLPIKGLGIKSDQEKYIGRQKTEYWQHLFNLGVWKYLEKDNEVTYMKRP